MKHKIRIYYDVAFTSFWEVEAPDEKTAKQMAEDALMGGDEDDKCHRTIDIDDNDGITSSTIDVEVMHDV